jgi:hypothetical protein
LGLLSRKERHPTGSWASVPEDHASEFVFGRFNVIRRACRAKFLGKFEEALFLRLLGLEPASIRFSITWFALRLC